MSDKTKTDHEKLVEALRFLAKTGCCTEKQAEESEKAFQEIFIKHTSKRYIK